MRSKEKHFNHVSVVILNHLPSQEIPSAMSVYPAKQEHTTFPSTILQMCLQGPLSITAKLQNTSAVTTQIS